MTRHEATLVNRGTRRDLLLGRALLILESRNQTLRRKQLDDLSVLARHFQQSRLIAEYEADKAIIAIWRAATHAIITTNREFNATGHYAPLSSNEYAQAL
jgi:FlaA1/EpsC-like NDP-sugar epimerase